MDHPPSPTDDESGADASMGSPDVITVESLSAPEPADNEVLVHAHAAGVGPWDALIRTGRSGLQQTLPLTLGSEVSGVVDKIGARSTDFAIGDAVFGATNPRCGIRYRRGQNDCAPGLCMRIPASI